jgi:cyanoexosortase A
MNMKATSLNSLKPLQNTEFWLLAIAGGLIAVHLSLSWRLDANLSQLSISVLGWGAVLSLLWDKRHTFKLQSDVFSSLLGLLLIAFVLLRSLSVTQIDSVFELSPFIAALGVAMLASGVKGLQQYWLELMIILAVNLPIGALLEQIEISTITAKFANAMLSYLGFEVSRQGVNIILPTGAVEVNRACSGLEGIVRLLRLSVLFLVMFPVKLAKSILVPVVAVLVAFIVNGVRVALMAFLVAYSNKEAFEYWHKGDGAQVFFLISTLVFGLFCYFISQKDDPNDREPMEISGS